MFTRGLCPPAPPASLTISLGSQPFRKDLAPFQKGGSAPGFKASNFSEMINRQYNLEEWFLIRAHNRNKSSHVFLDILYFPICTMYISHSNPYTGCPKNRKLRDV